jgi:hypothetical protein
LSASGTERGCPARHPLSAGGGRCVPGGTGRCGGVDVGEGLPSTMRMSASKPGGSRPLRPARLRAAPAWWVDADSAPALPRDSAMSATAYGNHMVRLVGAIPASGPMTTRVPPSIRETHEARGRRHMAAGGPGHLHPGLMPRPAVPRRRCNVYHVCPRRSARRSWHPGTDLPGKNRHLPDRWAQPSRVPGRYLCDRQRD